MKRHITPGHNGWTHDAHKIIRAIDRKEAEKRYAANEEKRYRERLEAELSYYDENDCYPQPTGYCGTETDAHFYER